jgi:hypothetical protein
VFSPSFFSGLLTINKYKINKPQVQGGRKPLEGHQKTERFAGKTHFVSDSTGMERH